MNKSQDWYGSSDRNVTDHGVLTRRGHDMSQRKRAPSFRGPEHDTMIWSRLPSQILSPSDPSLQHEQSESSQIKSLATDYEKQLVKNQNLKEEYDKLVSLIESRDDELDNVSKKLAQERSLMDSWTIQARKREKDLVGQIEYLKKQNEDMYSRVCKGRRTYVSHDEFRDSLNTWYSAATAFCPKYFPYNGDRESLFYYEWQSKLFDSIIVQASASFLVSAQLSLSTQMKALAGPVWKRDLDIGVRLPFYPSLVSSLLGDDHVRLTRERLASHLHEPDVAQLMTDIPAPLRLSIDATKTKVRRDLAHFQHQDVGRGRDDPLVSDQLDYLIISFIYILLNTESSSLCYRFIRIDPNELFDSERMEPVGTWTGMENFSSQGLKVRLAMTRALVECDDEGIPQTCVAKAKVILKSG